MSPSKTSVVESLSFEEFTNTVNGESRQTKETRTGVNPATKKALPPVPVSTPEDLDEAVAAARAAFPAWRDTPREERAKKLLAWGDAITKHADAFAKLLVQEQGKPIFLAKREVDMTADHVKTTVGIEIPEEIVEETENGKTVVRYTPIGVCAGIVPWNFPVNLAIAKITPALLTGNVIIIKPSPFTPYCDLKLCELGRDFFPPGVLQCLSGDDNLGPWITSHPGIDKISFTGSSATGKRVMESCSKTLKRVTLELGGNDPAIIFDDVDIATVAPAIASLAFLNSGQICLAIKRVFVHRSIYDKFRDAMAEFTKNLQVGDGFTDGVFMGPVQNGMQYERVRGFFEDIKKEGQKVVAGGQFVDSAGYFIQPTIVDEPKEDSRIVQEEPFGPIVPLMAFDTEEEAIARANKTDMGLGASVWSKDLVRAERVARKLEAGSVWVNEHMAINPVAPFGGHKSSGIGTELGRSGQMAYCNSQSLFLKKPKANL